jgi:hypothetical protein
VCLGFALAAPVESLVLAVALKRVPLRRRVLMALAMNACSHPIMVVIIEPILRGRLPGPSFVIVTEALVIGLEIALVALMTDGRWRARDAIVIALANVASFGVGLVVFGPPTLAR